jgi:hypothetical protein
VCLLLLLKLHTEKAVHDPYNNYREIIDENRSRCLFWSITNFIDNPKEEMKDTIILSVLSAMSTKESPESKLVFIRR